MDIEVYSTFSICVPRGSWCILSGANNLAINHAAV